MRLIINATTHIDFRADSIEFWSDGKLALTATTQWDTHWYTFFGDEGFSTAKPHFDTGSSDNLIAWFLKGMPKDWYNYNVIPKLVFRLDADQTSIKLEEYEASDDQ